MESLPTESILLFLENKALPEFEYLNIPCHTQTMEMCVMGEKYVEKTVEIVRATLLSKPLMPKFYHKSDFTGIPI